MLSMDNMKRFILDEYTLTFQLMGDYIVHKPTKPIKSPGP